MTTTPIEAARSEDRSATKPVRPVDALERLFYRYSERNPAHFLIVAEFDTALQEAQVRSALGELRRRHPLMSVHVEDHPGTGLGFYRAHGTAPIPLRVRSDTQWQRLAAEELGQPFDRSTAPLVRAILLTGSSYSAVLLTFDHTVADGISSVRVLNDLIAALNGESLAALPLPPSYETALTRRFTGAADHPAVERAEPDPRMLMPTSIRAFDGTVPDIHGVAMDPVDTATLVSRCRTERATVHAAIVTAASRVRGERRGEDYVRVMSPINTRSLIDVGGDCADYFSCAVTGMAPLDGSSFWDQARTVNAELSVPRSSSGVLASSAAVEQAIGVDANATAAEELLTRGLPFDLMITNLGVQDLEISGPIAPTALWAPVLCTQIADDTVIGVTTHRGVLRMVACGYAPTAEFLEAVAVTLREAAR